MPSSPPPDLRRSPIRGLALSLLGPILALSSAPAFAEAGEPSLEMPFVIEGTGMGGGWAQGAVVIRAGTGGEVASYALVQALQAMGMSIVRPALAVGRPVPPGRPWTTDITVLPPSVIADYNRVHGALTLPAVRYGLRYSGRFAVDHGRFRYVISAQLFQRGALSSNWSRVKDDRYFGTFFVDRLTRIVAANLRSRSAA